jgi:hypothetical protein
MIELGRGELAFATRFLASKWRWSEARVRRFLKRLESDAMVYVQTTRDATHITICNYDKYAFGRRTDDAQTDAQTDEPATHSRRKEEEPKNLRKIDDDGDDAREPTLRQSALELADEIAVAVGHDLAFVPPAWCGAANRVEMWLTNGWPRELILETVRGVMARKRDGPPDSIQYFEKPIAKAFAQSAKPLPTVVIDSSPEKIHVRTQADRGQHRSVSTSLESILARIEDFDAPGGGGGAGAPDVRLLSKG